MKMRAYVAGGLLLAGVLAGCSRSEPEDEAPVENMATEAPAETVAEPEPQPEPAPVANVAEPVRAAPPPEIAPDEQTQDDADATGYTARVQRDDAEQPAAANETETK